MTRADIIMAQIKRVRSEKVVNLFIYKKLLHQLATVTHQDLLVKGLKAHGYPDDHTFGPDEY